MTALVLDDETLQALLSISVAEAHVGCTVAALGPEAVADLTCDTADISRAYPPGTTLIKI